MAHQLPESGRDSRSRAVAVNRRDNAFVQICSIREQLESLICCHTNEINDADIRLIRELSRDLSNECGIYVVEVHELVSMIGAETNRRELLSDARQVDSGCKAHIRRADEFLHKWTSAIQHRTHTSDMSTPFSDGNHDLRLRRHDLFSPGYIRQNANALFSATPLPPRQNVAQNERMIKTEPRYHGNHDDMMPPPPVGRLNISEPSVEKRESPQLLHSDDIINEGTRSPVSSKPHESFQMHHRNASLETQYADALTDVVIDKHGVNVNAACNIPRVPQASSFLQKGVSGTLLPQPRIDFKTKYLPVKSEKGTRSFENPMSGTLPPPPTQKWMSGTAPLQWDRTLQKWVNGTVPPIPVQTGQQFLPTCHPLKLEKEITPQVSTLKTGNRSTTNGGTEYESGPKNDRKTTYTNRERYDHPSHETPYVHHVDRPSSCPPLFGHQPRVIINQPGSDHMRDGMSVQNETMNTNVDANTPIELKLAQFNRKYTLAKGFVSCRSSNLDRDRLKSQMFALQSEIEDMAFVGGVFSNTLDDVNRMLLEIVDLFQGAEETRQPNQHRGNQNHQVKFKDFEIPKFDGTIRGYISFKSSFRSLVEENMTEELALKRLQQECVVKNTIPHLLVAGKETLNEAMAALDQQFAKGSVIKDAVLKDLKMLKAVSRSDDFKGLLVLVSEVTRAKEDLKRCGMEHALGESAFSWLMTKIPTLIREKIDDRILDDDLDSIEQIDIFLKVCSRQASLQQAHTLRTEAHGNSVVAKGESGPSSTKTDYKGKSLYSNPSIHLSGIGDDQELPETDLGDGKGVYVMSSKNSKLELRCAFHPDISSHATINCYHLMTLSSANLEKAIREKGLCEVCLGKHSVKHCRSKRFCPEPGCPEPGTHHKLLHISFLERKKTASSSKATPTQVNAPPKAVSSSSPDISSASQCSDVAGTCLETPPASAYEAKQINTQLGHNTIRPCHRAYLKGRDGTLFPIQVMYDTGGDLSQITTEVASKCAAEPVNSLSNLKISVAGGTSAQNWGRADLYTIPVYDSCGNCVINLNCVSVNNIGFTKEGSVEHVAREFEHLGHDVGELLAPESGDIHMLIGCNYSNLQPQPIAVSGMVTLARTRFGTVLYGAHSSFPKQNVTRNAPSSFIETVVATQHCVMIDSKADLEPRGALEEVANDASGQQVMVNCCPCIYTATIAQLSKPERDMFDRMVALDDQLTCVKCRQCLSEPDKEHMRKVEMYRNCLRYDEEQKVFTAEMPWTDDIQNLPDNFVAAVKRLDSLTKSMKKDEHLRLWYRDEFEKLIANGILVLVSDEENRVWVDGGGKIWYIGHFAVLNESSVSTPLRIVFDPTIKFRGILIDRLWEPPPNLIPNLPGLLLRFRERPIPICMDISKAYWSVMLDPLESHLHRVVWNRLDPEEPVKIYRMKRNCWGTKPAGSLCSLAMIITAEMHRDEYPQVFDFVTNQVYVDDGTSSVETTDEALKLARDTCHVLSKGGFVVKYFIIGGVPLDITELANREELPEQVRFGGEQTERVLGLLWNPMNDTISFSCRVNFSKRVRGAHIEPDIKEEHYDDRFPDPLTLRKYTSQVNSLFDPPGLTTPVTVVMKHELGLIFTLGGGWDDPIPHENRSVNLPTTHERCKEIIKSFYDLAHLTFPRCLRPKECPAESNPLLVIFCDASQTAYGAVAYYNWETPSGERLSRLVAAKAKPVPKKLPLLTIPRAEVMGAVIGVHLAENLIQNTTYDISNRMFLLDSTIALSQIASPARKFKTWVASRLDEINRIANPSEFYHIASSLNIADDASRGLQPGFMTPESRWQNGEAFMKLPVEEWPVRPLSEVASSIGHDRKLDADMEVRHHDPRMVLYRTPASMLVSRQAMGMSEMSENHNAEAALFTYLLSREIREMHENESWTRARRRVARVIHFIQVCATLIRARCTRVTRSKVVMECPPNLCRMTRSRRYEWFEMHDQFCPSVKQMKLSQMYWILQSQRDYLKSPVLKSIARLNPVLGTDGVWSVCGRTCHASPLPIIPNSPLAMVVLRHFHEPYHCGSHATLAAAREYFWIVNGAVLANRLVGSCARCRRLKKRVTAVIMAPLKPEQLRRSQVFQYVAVDLCGPYQTKTDRRSTRQQAAVAGKVWVLVIVCAASRAVQLELCEGYDTTSFLVAFDNFSDLRGRPERVVADQGSQIVGASNLLQNLWTTVDPSQLRKHTVGRTTWEFIPSGAHHFIGMAERVVQSFKRTMEAVLYSRQPMLTKTSFMRTLYSIANILNSRPLALQHSRASKFEECKLVRPNDLLLGRSTTDISPVVPADEIPVINPKHYTALLRQKEAFLDEFWNKWKQVVFPSLMPRSKWLGTGRPLRPGDIVLVRDTNQIRGVWTVAEVMETHRSPIDHLIRRATVRYKLEMPSARSEYKGTKSKVVIKAVRDLCVILEHEER